MFDSATRVRKFIAAVVGTASAAVANGLVPDAQAKWVTGAILFLTTLGVYAVKNEQ